MLRRIAEDLSLMMISNKIIKIEEREFYIFGIELFMCNLFIALAITLLAFLTNMVLVSVIYAVAFCSLRVYAGGHHCKTYLRCFCTSVGIYICMIATNLAFLQQKGILTLLLFAISLPVILIFAPVESADNPFSEAQDKLRCRRIVLVLTALFSVAAAVSLLFRQIDIAYAIACAMAAVSSQIIIAKAGGVKHEKTNP